MTKNRLYLAAFRPAGVGNSFNKQLYRIELKLCGWSGIAKIIRDRCLYIGKYVEQIGCLRRGELEPWGESCIQLDISNKKIRHRLFHTYVFIVLLSILL